MKRLTLCLAASAIAVATLPAIAQMPTTPPGAPDVKRVSAGDYKADPYHTQVSFTVNHLGFSFYRGIFGDISGTLSLDPKAPDKAKVMIDIPMSGITTTSSALNEHLKTDAFFDAAKFPTAHFESTSITTIGTKATITGTLTIRGITKPVTLHAAFVGAGRMFNPMDKTTSDQVGFEATTTVKRSDYGVSYGVPLVSDEVPLTISVAFMKPAPAQ